MVYLIFLLQIEDLDGLNQYQQHNQKHGQEHFLTEYPYLLYEWRLPIQFRDVNSLF